MGKGKGRMPATKAPDRLVNVLSWRWAILRATAEEMPATRALLLLALSCHMNEAGDGCWPSQATLAAETKLSRRAVQDHLKAAVEAGWIVRRAVWEDGAIAGTVYHTAIPQAVLERMQAPVESGPAPVEDEALEGGGAAGAPPPVDVAVGEGVAQEVRRGGAGDSPGWRTTCAGVAQEVRPNSTGNSTRNSTEKENSDSAAPIAALALGQSPEAGQPAATAPLPAMPPVRPMRVTQEELDSARITVCQALGLPAKAWLPAQPLDWESLWRSCTGDVEELVKVFKLGRRQRELAGHNGVTLRYVQQHYDELRALVYLPAGSSAPNRPASGRRSEDVQRSDRGVTGGGLRSVSAAPTADGPPPPSRRTHYACPFCAGEHKIGTRCPVREEAAL